MVRALAAGDAVGAVSVLDVVSVPGPESVSGEDFHLYFNGLDYSNLLWRDLGAVGEDLDAGVYGSPELFVIGGVDVIGGGEGGAVRALDEVEHQRPVAVCHRGGELAEMLRASGGDGIGEGVAPLVIDEWWEQHGIIVAARV